VTRALAKRVGETLGIADRRGGDFVGPVGAASPARARRASSLRFSTEATASRSEQAQPVAREACATTPSISMSSKSRIIALVTNTTGMIHWARGRRYTPSLRDERDTPSTPKVAVSRSSTVTRTLAIDRGTTSSEDVEHGVPEGLTSLFVANQGPAQVPEVEQRQRDAQHRQPHHRDHTKPPRRATARL